MTTLKNHIVVQCYACQLQDFANALSDFPMQSLLIPSHTMQSVYQCRATMYTADVGGPVAR